MEAMSQLSKGLFGLGLSFFILSFLGKYSLVLLGLSVLLFAPLLFVSNHPLFTAIWLPTTVGEKSKLSATSKLVFLLVTVLNVVDLLYFRPETEERFFLLLQND
jgi:hypothetical protein